MKRILVEFYSADMAENLISLLRETYDGVVFVYFSKEKKPTRMTRARLREVLGKHLGFAPSFLPIGEHSLQATVAAFSRFSRRSTKRVVSLWRWITAPVGCARFWSTARRSPLTRGFSGP